MDRYALIGDLVDSRESSARALVQDALRRATQVVNEVVPAVRPLAPTVGDEFQGVFATIGDASRAALLVRLLMAEVIDLRCGIGYGASQVLDRAAVPPIEDGPAWWAAREALEELAKPSGRNYRSWVVGGEAAAANAFLIVRDQLVDVLNDRGRRVLLGALIGATQKQIAEREHISQSAVSQQFKRGVRAIVEAQTLFEEATR